jgi:hypothetical protein
VDGPGFGLAVALEIKLPGVDKATAQKLADTAHRVCYVQKYACNLLKCFANKVLFRSALTATQPATIFLSRYPSFRSSLNLQSLL